MHQDLRTCLLLAAITLVPAGAVARVTGEPRKWHRVTVTFDGPATGEEAPVNPFRDCRLEVTFSHAETGKAYVVPGYYAADGRAAGTGAAGGSKWRVHFAPDEVGRWGYTASFRVGKDVALAPEPAAGRPARPDGQEGRFDVRATNKRGRDHRARGMLRYVGERYLRFAGTGEYFIKGGADSPETFLAYLEFDATPKPRRYGGHTYGPHLRDWRRGDPVWRGGRGKGIIGALNYLAGKGMNSVYFLTMNVKGDGDDVWPWTSKRERFRFDCSKLDQWEIVFSHMDSLGVMLHVLTQETENDQLLDGGDLGPERKLYYRELVARFAHHLALVWNLGEENTNTPAQLKAFAEYLRGLDPYDHPIIVHTFPGQYDEVYTPLLGFEHFEGPSLQVSTRNAHRETAKWIDRSAAAGRQWVVCVDETGPCQTRVPPDDVDPGHDQERKEVLWGNLMAGGAGVEWYFAYKYHDSDIDCEDWRSRDRLWDQTRYALEFFHAHLPFAEMSHHDGLTSNRKDYCLAQPGRVYAVYLPDGGTTDLDLGRMSHEFTVRWYDPRRGGPLLKGSVASVSGPGRQSIGTPPRDAKDDWVALVKASGDVALHELTVSGGTGGGVFPDGAAVVISASPPPGKVFDRWTGDVDAVENVLKASATVTMPARALAVEAVFREGPPGPAVLSFTLVDADADVPVPGLDPLTDGAKLDLGKLPTRNLNVRANTSPPTVGSVRFGLDGDEGFHTESSTPYALAGDAGGDYRPWTPAPGEHTLTATAYSEAGGGGAAGGSLSIRFEVVDRGRPGD